MRGMFLAVLFACALLCVLDIVLRTGGQAVKWRIAKWRILTTIVIVLPLILVVALLWPHLSPSQFDSKRWKSGNRWSRGAMVQDIIGRNLLIGKSRSEVQDLLGQPDYCGVSYPSSDYKILNAKCSEPRVDWFGYKVVTNPRCNYFWECRMNVNLNKTTYRVEELNVSD